MAGQLPGDDHLLLVAARQGGDGHLGAGRPHVEVLHQLLRRAGRWPGGLGCRDGCRGSGGTRLSTRLSATLKGPTTPCFPRSSGTWPTPRLLIRRGEAWVTSWPRMSTRPERAGRRPDERLHQLALAVALHARDAEDLAGPDLEVEAVHRAEPPVVLDVEPVDPQDDLTDDRGSRVRREGHVAADHERRQARLRGRGRLGLADDGAAAEHHDPVGRGQHLAQLVGDEDHGLALVDQAPQDLEELVHLARGEHGGRLVEDQDVGVAVEGLHQLDALLLAHRQIADHGVGVDVEPVALGEVADPLACGVEVEADPLARLVAEDDVLGDGEHRDELEVLVDHPDAGGDGVGAAVEAHRLAPQEQLAGVGLVEPEHDVHQRALAGPVLAEEAEHLALVEHEVDVLVRDDAREGLGDPPDLEDRRPRGGGRSPRLAVRGAQSGSPVAGSRPVLIEPSARPCRVSSSLAATSSGISASWGGA